MGPPRLVPQPKRLPGARKGNSIILLSKLQLQQAGTEGPKSQKGHLLGHPLVMLRWGTGSNPESNPGFQPATSWWLKARTLSSLSFRCLIDHWRGGWPFNSPNSSPLLSLLIAPGPLTSLLLFKHTTGPLHRPGSLPSFSSFLIYHHLREASPEHPLPLKLHPPPSLHVFSP